MIKVIKVLYKVIIAKVISYKNKILGYIKDKVVELSKHVKRWLNIERK